MRKLLLFPALFLTCATAVADVGDNANTTGVPSIGGIFPHFSTSASNNNRVTTTNMRMIAKSYAMFKDGSFIAVDSTTYQYAVGRGSLPNAEEINKDEHVVFDVSVKYKFNPLIGGYENDQRRQQTFVNNKVKVLVYENWHTANASWKNEERYTYTYDNNGKMQASLLEQWYGNLWTNGLNSTLNYDLNNNVILMNSTTYNVDFVYDANNNLMTVQDKIWVQGTGWSYNERKSYSYSGKDVVGYALEKWINGSWVFMQSWQYKYDASGNVIQTIEYEWNGNGWTEVLQRDCVFDVDNNKVEETLSLWNVNNKTFEPRKKEVRTYSLKSVPEVVKTYTWNGQSWIHATGDIVVKYYYELYYPAGVHTTAQSANLTVYPVPANDYVSVGISLDEPTTISVTVIDMTGRAVYEKTEMASGSYSSNVPVHNLPIGNYVIKVSDGSFNFNKKISVID